MYDYVTPFNLYLLVQFIAMHVLKNTGICLFSDHLCYIPVTPMDGLLLRNAVR